MTTNEAIQFLDFWLQKETGGFVTPTKRDLAINRAQYEYFAKQIGTPIAPDGTPSPVAYDRDRRIADSLLPFKTEVGINLTNGVGTFPSDYVYLDAFRVRYYQNPSGGCEGEQTDPEGVLRYAPLDVVSEQAWADRTMSLIDFPTFQYPIVRFKTKTSVEVSPRTIRRIDLIYLRSPLKFYWGRQLQNGRYIYDPNDPLNQELEWEEIDQNQILIRALSYFGINLREGDLLNYAELKMKEGV